MSVNHANPVHDGFCRCRACKPPLVGEHSRDLTRVWIATAGFGLAGACLIIARSVGAA